MLPYVGDSSIIKFNKDDSNFNMSFLDIRFPGSVRYTLVGGPEFCTTVSINRSKFEIRNSLWLNSRRRYNIAYEACNKDELDAILSFFHICQGKAHGFRYQDWSDYQCINQTIGTGNGFDCKFQLIKDYVLGHYKTSRLITKPIEGSVKIRLNDVLQESDIEYDAGIVTFNQAPAQGAIINASFLFDTPVRFDIDFLPITMVLQGRYSIKDVSLVELIDQ